MGVSWVMSYSGVAGEDGSQPTTPQAIETLERRLEGLGGERAGIYTVEMETFIHAQDSSKAFHTLMLSENPLTSFGITEGGTCVVGDLTLHLLLMHTLRPHYVGRRVEGPKSKIEVKGKRYLLGDFVVKIGSAFYNGNVRGALLEVEYQPCVSVPACIGLLREFVTGLTEASRNDIMNTHLTAKTEMSGTGGVQYSAADTAHQYLEVLKGARGPGGDGRAPTPLASNPHTPQGLKT